MISNIFGLHLGCMVKCKGWKKTGFVFRILPDYEDVSKWEIGVIFWNKNKTWNEIHDIPISDCKLLLKPLSDMSDEDKRELENIMMCNFKFEEVYLYDLNKGHPNHKKQCIVLAKTAIGTELYVNGPDQIIWLCSKGYDVGLVPDEYKEIINGKD